MSHFPNQTNNEDAGNQLSLLSSREYNLAERMVEQLTIRNRIRKRKYRRTSLGVKLAVKENENIELKLNIVRLERKLLEQEREIRDLKEKK